MAQHGYMMFTFRIHNHGDRTSLPLGALSHDRPAARDALTLLYGIMRGLIGQQIDVQNRHLNVLSVHGEGRCIRFDAEVGRSGEKSTIRDPNAPGRAAFERREHHIDNTHHRGLIVVPTNATNGLLILQTLRRRSGQAQLTPVLKRVVRRLTGLIVDFDALVHEAVLKEFINQAEVNEITLRRSGWPRDIADMMEVGDQDQELGSLRLIIGRGRIGPFKRSVASKLRSSPEARDRLLHVGGLDFNELNVAMQVGDRRTTLSVTADRVPSFVYHLSGEPNDTVFYREVREMVTASAPVLGITLGEEWVNKPWSAEARDTVVEVLPAEVSRNVDEPE